MERNEGLYYPPTQAMWSFTLFGSIIPVIVTKNTKSRTTFITTTLGSLKPTHGGITGNSYSPTAVVIKKIILEEVSYTIMVLMQNNMIMSAVKIDH